MSANSETQIDDHGPRIGDGWSSMEEIIDWVQEEHEEDLDEVYPFDDATELINYIEDELLPDEEDLNVQLGQMENPKCDYCIMENAILGVDGYDQESYPLDISDEMEEYFEELDISEMEERDPTIEKQNWTTESDAFREDKDVKYTGHFTGYCPEHSEQVFLFLEESWYDES